MKKSMMQIYARNSAEALAVYQRAFDAPIGVDFRNPDGSCAHVELNVYGQIVAVSEAPESIAFGRNMQFCLHFEEDEKELVTRAYEILREGAEIIEPIGACPFSEWMFALVDRFGVHWCLWK